MLSVGPGARRVSPSQDVHLRTALPLRFGNVHYRHRTLTWRTIRLGSGSSPTDPSQPGIGGPKRNAWPRSRRFFKTRHSGLR